jgi:hypothetical protein
VTPTFVDDPDNPKLVQVNLKTLLLDVPDNLLQSVGLQQLTVEGKKSDAQKVISAEDLSTILATNAEHEGGGCHFSPNDYDTRWTTG